MKIESGANLRPERTILGTRVLADKHLELPDEGTWRCGCPQCLEHDGLELVEVVTVDGRSVFMLVDWFKPRIPGRVRPQGS